MNDLEVKQMVERWRENKDALKVIDDFLDWTVKTQGWGGSADAANRKALLNLYFNIDLDYIETEVEAQDAAAKLQEMLASFGSDGD